MQNTANELDTFDEAFKDLPTSCLIEQSSLLQIQKTIRYKTSTLYSSILDINQHLKNANMATPIVREHENYEDLKIIKLIGQGGFSEVFQAVNQSTGEEFALRLCNIDAQNFPHSRAVKEIDVYRQLGVIDHNNIAKIHTARIISSSTGASNHLSLQVVMELGICTLEDVAMKRAKEKKPWTEKELIKISMMLIDAMRVARQFGLSHRDLSLNNIILAQSLKDYKVIDFGEAKTISDQVAEIPIVGKYRYLAPEIDNIVKKRKSGINIPIDYDPELSDVYSMGIILGSISILENFDARDTDAECSAKLEKLRSCSPKMHSLVLDMINPLPHKRKSFSELMKNLNQTSHDIVNMQ